jgi:hypothetical protein
MVREACDSDKDLNRARSRALIGSMASDLPSWWCYPAQCGQGHEWGPGLISAGWTPCGCRGGLGHRTVRCEAEPGCRSVWYSPRHDPRAMTVGYPKQAWP